MKPIQIISNDVFDKIRSRFDNLQMGDETGAVTIDPREARFFDFDFVIEGENLGRVSISLNDLGSLKVYYSQGITENFETKIKRHWYAFLREMRFFAKRRLLRFDTRDIAKTNLDKNDFQHLAATQRPKEEEPMNTMNESKWNGRSSLRTSRAVQGRTEVIVRHAKPVAEYAGARSQKKNISAIFIQNSAGERFKYPFIHPAGAFAMAQHVDHGGVPHDPAGKAIIAMSEEIAQLQEFRRKIQTASLHDDAMGITERAVGRLNQLKEKIAALGKKHHYEAWMKEFNETEHNDILMAELDAVTLEDYKSKFTQRTFEEELTKFFPLLHRIMKETNKVDLEDYVSEAEWDYDPFKDERGNDQDPATQEVALKQWVIDLWINGKEIEEIAAEVEAPLETVTDIVDDYERDGEGEYDELDYETPEHQFEAWAEAVEQGKLTDDQIEELKKELAKLPFEGDAPELELGADGQTAWQFFNGLGLEDDDLKDMLKKASELDSETNAIEVFTNWAEKNYPELLVALGVSGDSEEQPQQPTETTLPSTGAPGLSTVHGVMSETDGNISLDEFKTEIKNSEDDVAALTVLEGLDGDYGDEIKRFLGELWLDFHDGAEETTHADVLKLIVNEIKSSNDAEEATSENDEGNMGAGMMSKESKHSSDDVVQEVAKIVKSFYNRDNPEVGPFRGHEGIATDVEKTVSEKFGERVGAQARALAEKFMAKLTQEWNERHGHSSNSVDQDDGLARIKELAGQHRTKSKDTDEGAAGRRQGAYAKTLEIENPFYDEESSDPAKKEPYLELTIRYDIHGKYYPATRTDPEEFPEVEIASIENSETGEDLTDYDEIYRLADEHLQNIGYKDLGSEPDYDYDDDDRYMQEMKKLAGLKK